MSTVISPTTPPVISLSLTGPSDGESANAASVNSPFAAIQNDVEALRQLTYGGGVQRRVTCGSNTSLIVQPLGAVVVTEAGIWTVLSHTVSTTLSPVALTGGLTNSTQYWVYAYDDAGSLNFTASVNASDLGLRYQTGNTDYFYVTTFFTDSSGNVIRYTQSDNYFSFNSRYPVGAGVKGNHVLDNASTVGPTTTSVSACVPSQARAFSVQARCGSSAVSDTYDIWQTGVSETSLKISQDSTIITGKTTLTTIGGLSFAWSVQGGVGLLNVDVEEFWL